MLTLLVHKQSAFCLYRIVLVDACVSFDSRLAVVQPKRAQLILQLVCQMQRF